MTPNLIDILNIMERKAEAVAALDEIDKEIQLMLEVYGSGRFDFDLLAFVDEKSPDRVSGFERALLEDGHYIKFELVDNVELLKAGQTVWKSAALKPASFVAQSLKRRPASLKE